MVRLFSLAIPVGLKKHLISLLTNVETASWYCCLSIHFVLPSGLWGTKTDPSPLIQVHALNNSLRSCTQVNLSSRFDFLNHLCDTIALLPRTPLMHALDKTS